MSAPAGFSRTPLRRRLLWGAALGLLAGLLAWALGGVSHLRTFEARTLDVRQKLFARPTPAVDRVAIVLIDEYSIRQMKEVEGLTTFPWPRDVYQAMIDFLKKAGARAMVFDMVFSDSPNRKIDQVFADAARAAGNANFTAKLETFSPEPEKEAAALKKMRAPVEGWSFPLRPDLTGLLPPIPELVEAAQGIGLVNVVQDDDSTLRRADLLLPYPDSRTLLPSLGFEAARAALGREEKGAVHGGALHFAGRRIPLCEDGRMLVRFYGKEGTFATVTAVSVIRSYVAQEEGKPLSVDPAIFKDRVVFIGLNAAGREDIVPAPVSTRFPGTEFMATVCANILGGDFLAEPGSIARLALLLAWGLASGLLLFALWRPLPASAAALAALAAQGGAAALAFTSGLALEMFFPALALLGNYLGALLLGYLIEGRAKREISRAFSQYLSPVVIRDLMKNPEALKLGGETREITVYFSDIQGFSSFSERMSPQELVGFLNVYLSAMTDVILQGRGVIDKFEGDAIMAFWGAPAPLEGHAREACLAVLEQRRALAGLNQRFQAEGRPLLRFRAGLNSGPAVVGNMGSSQRFAYTAMGDTVNLASRLEGANKFFGTAVMMSEAVRSAAGPEIAARRLGRIQVVGKKVPVAVYELLGRAGDLSDVELRRLGRYHEALAQLEEGRPGEAERLFEELLKAPPGRDGSQENARPDPVLELCLKKCRELKERPEGWEGIWVLTSK